MLTLKLLELSNTVLVAISIAALLTNDGAAIDMTNSLLSPLTPLLESASHGSTNPCQQSSGNSSPPSYPRYVATRINTLFARYGV